MNQLWTSITKIRSMTEECTGQKPENTITLQSARFGELVVPADSIISFPQGIIGFADAHEYVLIDHKPPFSWLHSSQEAHLAFVVIDGMEFGDNYRLIPPIGNDDIDLREDDEYAILVVVTVRPDPMLTTANLKAPLFVNLRTRRGIQVIYDNPHLSTRHQLFSSADSPDANQVPAVKESSK